MSDYSGLGGLVAEIKEASRNGFLLPPERLNIVLSCLVDPSDLSGLVNRVAIIAASIRFLIDNAKMGLGACR